MNEFNPKQNAQEILSNAIRYWHSQCNERFLRYRICQTLRIKTDFEKEAFSNAHREYKDAIRRLQAI